eukprot:GCRY01001691.1.p1 GENE.GCRY01001691.1~~GCRY01001691.1.p1  ORF type:complete len:384 (-),score=135.80 GCRY01001691.1:541-1692(-)
MADSNRAVSARIQALQRKAGFKSGHTRHDVCDEIAEIQKLLSFFDPELRRKQEEIRSISADVSTVGMEDRKEKLAGLLGVAAADTSSAAETESSAPPPAPPASPQKARASDRSEITLASERQVSQLQREVDNLSSENSELRSAQQQLVEERARREEVLQAAQDRQEQLADRVSTFESEVGLLRREKEADASEIAALKDSLARETELRSQLAAAQAQQAAENSHEQADNIAKLQSELAESQSTVTQLQERNAQLQEEKAELAKTHTAAYGQLLEEQRALKARLEESEQARQALETEKAKALLHPTATATASPPAEAVCVECEGVRKKYAEEIAAKHKLEERFKDLEKELQHFKEKLRNLLELIARRKARRTSSPTKRPSASIAN